MARNRSAGIIGFPKAAGAQIQGGRFGGALLALEDFDKRQTASKEAAVKEREFGFKERTAEATDLKNVISFLNKRNDQIAKINAAEIGATKGTNFQPNIQPFLNLEDAKRELGLSGVQLEDEDKLNRPDAGGGIFPAGRDPAAEASIIARGQQQQGGLGGQLLTGVQQTASNLNVPGAVGQGVSSLLQATGGQGLQAGANIATNTRSQIQQLLQGLEGKFPGINAPQAPTGAAAGAGAVGEDRTDEFIEALEDSATTDEAIEDIIDVINRFQEAGEDLSGQVDVERFLEAFEAKFGKAARTKLERRVDEF